ncbi:transcriptional regulator [Mycobacterium dioxanotrophicus]|uniref:Transcriptional regulator n=1 Tax=Mycobacterium dioxanotrophicus TaxID=482462 RepID=A0A1Y0C6M7_9MYCO|nr:helix-turn-helix domain-containing protein [Mycobacterium dioxanotrophicus]ART70888.1 transcriptional regulator [Mycobacterium dioxanotrophicus]
MSRRADVLEILRAATEPMTIIELADALEVHPNTARFHLEALVDTGQVQRVDSDHRGPGRPPQLFRAVRRMDPGGPTRYRVLADILTQALATEPDPGARALDIGRAWGRGVPQPNSDSPAGALVGLLDEFGFAPERSVSDQVRLRHCPFLELAETRAAVVCPIHLGLMQGALESWQSPIGVDRLDAFVEPDLCLVHLTTEGDTR